MLARSRHGRLLRTRASFRLDSARGARKLEHVLVRLWLAIRLQATNSLWAPVLAVLRTPAQTSPHTEAAYEQVRRIGRWEPQKRLLASGTCRLSPLFSQNAPMKENERVGNSGNIDSEVTGTPVVSESAIGQITLSVSILRKTGGARCWCWGFDSRSSPGRDHQQFCDW